MNGGFGDQLDVSEVIERYERWVFKVVNEEVGRLAHDNDDLVQEGRIAVWHAHERGDGRPGTPNYITQAARWRIKNVIDRGTWTGRDTSRAKPSDPRAHRDDLVSLDDLSVQSIIAAAGLLEHVELAYHYGEIHQAIAELTEDERRYVVMRFWHGMNEPEMQPYFAVNVGWVWRGHHGARAKLRARLEHLVGVV